MASRLEDQYRDFLATHLDLIEPGPTLIDKEFYLPNEEGARGFVDLLARDARGTIVVIELKQQDSAARQALHELFKYVALLARNHGLGRHQIRCIVLSTTWHELLVPFSDFIASAPFDAIGMRLHLADGDPSQCERITPLPPSAGTLLCPKHQVFLYSKREDRDAALPAISDALAGLGIEHFILLAEDYSGSSSSVMYAHGLYVALSILNAGLSGRIVSQLELDTSEIDEGLFMVEENVLGHLYTTAGCQSVEISTPDKFKTTHHSWPTSSIVRSGAFSSPLIWTDGAVISAIGAHGEQFTRDFWLQASSRNGAAWERGLHNLAYSLWGVDSWSALIPALLNEARATLLEPSISLHVFNPGDLVQALGGLGAGTPGFLPTVELMIDSDDGGPCRYLGSLLWNGETRPSGVVETIGPAIGGLDNYLGLRWSGDTWRYDTPLAEAHGLTFEILQIDSAGGPAQVVSIVDEKLSREPIAAADLARRLFTNFALENGTYLEALAIYVRENIFGSDPFFSEV